MASARDPFYQNFSLEMRGVKTAIAVEALKDAYIQQLPESDRDQIVHPSQFSAMKTALRKAIGSVLTQHSVDSLQRGLVYRKLGELNRAPFEQIVRRLCDAVGNSPTDEDIQLFIASRNKLIHQGQFYCIADPASRQDTVPPPSSPAAEYFFLTSFVDRLFLSLLGYHGPYIDWRVPGDPTRRLLP